MKSIESYKPLIALLLVATATESMLLLLPLYIGAIADSLVLTNRQLGVLGSADLLGIAASTLSAYWWLRKLSLRPLLLGSIAIFFIVNLASLVVSSVSVLIVFRLAAGLASGAAYAIALSALCSTINSERNTALMVCGQVMLGAVGSFLLPLVSAGWQITSIYLYMNLWVFAALVFVYLYFNPLVASDENVEGISNWRESKASAFLVALGTVGYFLTIGMVWGYLERIAREYGLSSTAVASSLGIGYVISLFGSLGAAWLGNRLGHALPMIVAGVVQILMLFLFTRLDHFENVELAFLLTNIVFQFFWSYIISYQIVIYSSVDRGGRFVATYGTFMHLALAAGPFIGSFLILGDSYLPILYAGIAAIIVCYVSFLLAIYLRDRAAESEVLI